MGASTAGSGPIRVLVVDDHEVVRVGLAALIRRQPDMEWAGEADGQESALRAARECRPDVVVMDVRLPDGDGIEACRILRETDPACRVLMLSSFSDAGAVRASIRAGASGFLLKRAHSDLLVQAIRIAAAGGTVLDPQMTGEILSALRGEGLEDPLAALSETEREVLERIARGETNRQIGQELHLSEKTVKHYVSSIFDKLQVRRRSEAAALAARRLGEG
ncbi:MAG: response regulator transcription factor [Bacillota bacterium]|nr:response regulator transcription factor [Bacillota bacterium]